MMRRAGNRFRLTVTAMAVAGLSLSGCATGYTTAADDACSAQRADLKSVEDYFLSSAVTGAVAGGLIGGLAGGLIGGDAKSALIGAGAGAVAGGLGGYFYAKQNATTDRVTLVNSVYGDLSTENANIDRTTLAFRNLRDCRFRTADQVKADYAGGKIDRPTAEARLARARQLFQEDVAYAESLGAKMDERGKEYKFAADELIRQDPQAQQAYAQRTAAASTTRPRPSTSSRRSSAPAPAASPAAAPPTDTAGVVQLSESNQLKRRALSDDVGQAKVAAATAFELDGKISRIPAVEDAAPRGA